MLTISRMTRLFTTASLALAVTTSACAQIETLKERNDKYIDDLSKFGMSDLLKRFEEVDKPTERVAALKLQLRLNQFIAKDLMTRSTAAFNNNQIKESEELFFQSRAAFEKALEAQVSLINDQPADATKPDERTPIWQTDLVNMVAFEYLPVYHRDAPWIYEFGTPTAEQKAAYEKWMVQALVGISDAKKNLDMLDQRLGGDADLRGELEELGIWFKINDYRSLNTPFLLGVAAHGVAMLPSDADYYTTPDKVVHQQRNEPAGEKARLRKQAAAALRKLAEKDGIKDQATLLLGQMLVYSSDEDDVFDGVEYLETVLENNAAQPYQKFIASLSKAIGMWNSDDEQSAIDILQQMGDDAFVKRDTSGQMRMVAADLLFRLLMKRAEAPGIGPRKKAELTAAAYEKAYVPLIELKDDDRFRAVLFTRWAKDAEKVEDPKTLPPAVRMGIGEQLMQEGAAAAQMLIDERRTEGPAVVAQKEAWEKELDDRRTEVDKTLQRAAEFNQTLIGEDEKSSPLLGRALYNHAMTTYYLAELDETFATQKKTKLPPWQDKFEAVKLWLSVAVRAPEASQAQQSLEYAIALGLAYDLGYNKDGVTEKEVRDTYKQTFLLLSEIAGNIDAVHNNRVYAGFQLFEKEGKFEEAVAVYRGLPSAHPDYYEARRQMIYVMQRVFRRQANERLFLSASKPGRAAFDADPQAKAKAEEAIAEWDKKMAKIEEDITRVRETIVDDAELIIIDAEEELDSGKGDPARLFKAASALGAGRVVLAGMESDAGNTDKALELLEGFEDQFSLDGKYVAFAAAGLEGDAAKAKRTRANETMRGLIQSAQEQRILSLLEAKQIDKMARQAREMMNASPSVASRVVNGVLARIGKNIEREERLVRELVGDAGKNAAKARIKFQADAAVALGELLVDWAEGKGYEGRDLIRYKVPLAEALMLAGRGDEAVKIIKPIAKEFKRDFRIQMIAGKAHLSVYRENKQADDYNAAMSYFAVIIKYYNLQIEKPAPYWEAWLNVLRLKEAAGDAKAKEIPGNARMLKTVDEEFGGPEFKEKFLKLFERNGGVEL